MQDKAARQPRRPSLPILPLAFPRSIPTSIQATRGIFAAALRNRTQVVHKFEPLAIFAFSSAAQCPEQDPNRPFAADRSPLNHAGRFALPVPIDRWYRTTAKKLPEARLSSPLFRVVWNHFANQRVCQRHGRSCRKSLFYRIQHCFGKRKVRQFCWQEEGVAI